MTQLLLTRLFNTAHEVSTDVPTRSGEKVYLHFMSELGEICEEANIKAGELYKSAGVDGVVGEACDVINCLADLVWVRLHKAEPHLLEQAVQEIVDAAQFKELDAMNPGNFLKAKNRLAEATSDLRRIHVLKWPSTTPLFEGEIQAVADMCSHILAIAKAADPDLTSAAFFEIYDAKCQKWRNKATAA